MSALKKGFVSVAFDAVAWPQFPLFPLPAPPRAASLQDRFEKGSAWADVDYAAYGEVVEAVGDVVGDGEVVDADVVADTAVTIPDTVASEALRVLHEVIVPGDRKISKSGFLIAARAGMVNLLLDADGVVRGTVKNYLDRFGIIAGARNGAFRTYMRPFSALADLVFERLGGDRDGALSRLEYDAGLESIGLCHGLAGKRGFFVPTRPCFLFLLLDGDGDGYSTRDEFCDGCSVLDASGRPGRSGFLDMFAVFDLDCDGQFSRQQWHFAFDLYDTNHDGLLSA